MKKYLLLLFFICFASLKGDSKLDHWDPVLKTDDGHKLRCRYFPPITNYEADGGGDATAVILIPDLGESKKNWKTLPKKLVKSGYAVLILELRGHSEGEDLEKHWVNYTTKEFNDMTKDVATARRWLKRQDSVHLKRCLLVGARLGANIALKAMEEDKEILGAYCLSPSVDYRGVKIDPSLETLKNRKLVLVCAEEDKVSRESMEEFKKSGVATEVLPSVEDNELDDTGTGLFRSRPQLSDKIVAWLKAI